MPVLTNVVHGVRMLGGIFYQSRQHFVTQCIEMGEVRSIMTQQEILFISSQREYIDHAHIHAWKLQRMCMLPHLSFQTKVFKASFEDQAFQLRELVIVLLEEAIYFI